MLNMKQIVILIACVLIYSTAISQNSNTIARLKFEEAEEAFNKNDFTAALLKLDEVEQLLGKTNPRILYLRILSQDNIIAADPLKDFAMLESIRKNCAFYLKAYENNEQIEEKFRQIYKISEKLKQYPETRSEFDTLQAAANVEKKKEEAAKNKKNASLQYVKTLCEKYKFKPGLQLQDFINYNAEAAVATRQSRIYGEGESWYRYTKGRNVYPIGANLVLMGNKNNPEQVTTYFYVIESLTNSADSITKLYTAFKHEILSSVDAAYLTEKETAKWEKKLIINIPDEKTTVQVESLNFSNRYALGITFKH